MENLFFHKKPTSSECDQGEKIKNFSVLHENSIIKIFEKPINIQEIHSERTSSKNGK